MGIVPSSLLITPLGKGSFFFAVGAGLSLPPNFQLTTSQLAQVYVQLVATDTQVLADHLPAHAAMDAAMPPSCNFVTTRETLLSRHEALRENY